MQKNRSISPARNALWPAGIYCVAAGAWIILSDRASVRLFGGAPQFHAVNEYKGLFFVAVTTVLLYYLLQRTLDSIASSQRALSESENRFAAFMDHLPVAAFVRDREGRYVYANAYWIQNFTGGADWQGETPRRFFSDPGMLRTTDEDHRRVLAGEPLVERSVRLRVNGIDSDWIVRRFPVQMSHGGETLVGAFALDVTDRHKLEEQLRQVAKMEAVGLLAGGIAHDFNNLLTVIGGYAQMLERMTRSGSAGAAHAASEIRKASERGALLTGQLLAFSRKQVAQPGPIDVGLVVTSMLSMLQRLVGDRIRLVPDLAAPAATVLADESQVQQVVLNLIVNARDAMPEGGTIRISTAEHSVAEGPAASIAGLKPGGYVMIAVADSGHGMDAATQARIFEPFFTTKERGHGTGLGLSTVYGIVTHGGGGIQVESAPGAGACFRVFLPRASQPLRGESKPGAVEEGRESVLLVEDDEAVRSVASQMLRALGYRVFEASSGPEAFEAFMAMHGDIELLITDVTMPDWQGPEVVKRLRESRPELPAIYITGYSAEMAAQPPGERDALVLRKPFTLESLSAAVRNALDSPGPGSG